MVSLSRSCRTWGSSGSRSSSRINRLRGKLCTWAWPASRPNQSLFSSVSRKPGQATLTLIPWRAHSRAIDLPIMITAAMDAQ